eukprot:NODE_115_length_2475_cov_53.618302_g81_i0.p1 GENE.NODE_115_length_2475_cov_53.618302_g81_i0~~NODE_115_length_2475_cov_53.618302_g81_i0.p1  ORF type:complete len:761 (+),score=210.35 NODE_115_length_2475_cov_53.618302_g81_i0:62-2344(+)
MGAVHKLVALSLVLIDFTLWFIFFGPLIILKKYLSRPKIFAKAVGTVDINVEEGNTGKPSPVYRSVEAIKSGTLAASPFPEVDTLWDMCARSHKVFARKRAYGIRPFLYWKDHSADTSLPENQRRFPSKYFGTTEWMQYQEAGVLAREFGQGLRAMGMIPQPEGDDFEAKCGPFSMLIFEDTSHEWMIAAQGAFSQSMVVVTAYATLGVEAVVAAVNEGEIATILCNRKSVEMIAKKIGDMPSLKNIIYTNLWIPLEETQTKLPGFPGVNVLSFAETLEQGKANPETIVRPKPDSMAVIMYTSGSTGKPKGVMVRHSQLLAMVASIKIQWPVLKEGSETYLAYLPLAHILEMASEFYNFGTGQAICYTDPKALMCRPGACYPTGSLEEFKPTLMAGVPKVWETIKSAANVKMSHAGPMVKAIMAAAFATKKWSFPIGKSTPLFNLLVFKKFKTTTGGRLKFGISGGGPISPEVQDWVRCALDCPLVQGYGLTETCGGLSVQKVDDFVLNQVGGPLPACEVTLHSEPEITDKAGKPYLACDTEQPIMDSEGNKTGSYKVLGRGEIWVRGNTVTSGYYRQPDKTAEEYVEGWFHTGDIGVMLPEGSLRIVDRKKNLVKLKGGEYIALEQMAVSYNNSEFVDVVNGGTCAYGDGGMDLPVLLAQANRQTLEATAKSLGIEYSSVEELCDRKEIKAAAIKSFQAAGKAGGLSRLEMVAGVALLLEPWTPFNGCKTPNDSKLQPKGIYEFNKKELEAVKPAGIRG